VTVHRVADHDVLAASAGNQLPHCASLDLLEVESQALAGVLRLLILRYRSFALRLYFHDVLIVGLIGKLLVVAARIDREARAITNARGIEARYGRAVVGRVVTAHVLRRQAGVSK